MLLFKNGALSEDQWRHLADGEDAPPSGHCILPLEWWQAERNVFQGSNVPVGISIAPGTNLDEIAADIPRLALIALPFPKFGDGRAFSMAVLLRERYGFTGELRATGDVLTDQLQLMMRCGFDAFEISNPHTQNAIREGRIAAFSHHYQAALGRENAAGSRPWLRRSAPGS